MAGACPDTFCYFTRLGDNWAWEPGASNRADQATPWWKAERVRATRERGHRVVWIVDECEECLRQMGQLALGDDQSWMTAPNLLTVCPSPSRGPTPADLDTIGAFLKGDERAGEVDVAAFP